MNKRCEVNYRKTIIFLIAVLIGFLMHGCGPDKKDTPEKVLPLVKLRESEYPQFKDDREFVDLSRAIEKSLTYLNRVPKNRGFDYGGDTYTAAHLIRSMHEFLSLIETQPNEAELNETVRKRFNVYRSSGNQDRQTLFTGYYEPTYPGSLKKNAQYLYPIYAKPDDLVRIDLSLFSDKYKGHPSLVGRVNNANRVVPYYSREKINAIKNFSSRARPVAWLESRIDRFFLEVQGSGRIALDTGKELRVHYALSNGNAYQSIGRYLIRKNEIPKEKMSMQAIRAWLADHPDRMDEVLHHNESFVFFKEEKGGPYGSLGVEITPFRSVATDRSLFPKGGVCFIQLKMPSKVKVDLYGAHEAEDWRAYSGFVMNQDTGGAIKGPARADIFCGNGDFAEFTAGHMNQYGYLFFIVLKE